MASIYSRKCIILSETAIGEYGAVLRWIREWSRIGWSGLERPLLISSSCLTVSLYMSWPVTVVADKRGNAGSSGGLS